MLRPLAAGVVILAGALVLQAETEDTVRKSVPVQSATRFGLDVDAMERH